MREAVDKTGITVIRCEIWKLPDVKRGGADTYEQLAFKKTRSYDCDESNNTNKMYLNGLKWPKMVREWSEVSQGVTQKSPREQNRTDRQKMLQLDKYFGAHPAMR